jgi:hypothetical protein
MSLLVIYKDILVNHIAIYLTREDLFVLSYVCRLYHSYFWKAYNDGKRLCSLVAGQGYLNVVKWLRANGCDWDADTCEYAAKGGYLDVLKWARDNGCRWCNQTCVAAAAERGQLDVLNWLKANGCPWMLVHVHLLLQEDI